MATNNSEQKHAEAEVDKFRKSLGPFVVAAETTRMPMVFTDARAPLNPIIFANDSFLRLTGYNREEVLGKSVKFLMADCSDSETQGLVETAFEDISGADLEFRCCRKDGSVFWTIMDVTKVLDKSGNTTEHFASFLDITKQKKEVDHLHFLLDELNHRTQNTLATVLAIAGRTLHGAVDNDMVEAFKARVVALSKAHSLLGRKNWDQLSLRDVVGQIFQPFDLNGRPDPRFLVSGGDVRLPPKTALTLALVFHELASNAAKFGALSNDAAGKVDISWRTETGFAGDRIKLRWQESGGPAVKPPGRKGFGSRLIEGALAQDLDGEVSIDYAPNGVICQIDMPVPGAAHG